MTAYTRCPDVSVSLRGHKLTETDQHFYFQSLISLFWLFYSCFIVCKTVTIKSWSPCSLFICFFISGVCFTFVQEVSVCWAGGNERWQPDGWRPGGAGRERERERSVSPAAALLMDGKINKETEKSICEESIRASEVKFVTDKLPERKRRRGRFIKNTRTAAGTSDLLRHVSVKCPFLTLKQKKKVWWIKKWWMSTHL